MSTLNELIAELIDKEYLEKNNKMMVMMTKLNE